jgi:hypothetical protein
MKRLLFITIIAAANSTSLFAQDFSNAGAYMDYIGKQQDNITKKYLSYNSAVSHGKRARKVEKLRSQLLNEVEEAKMNIGSMGKFANDGAYRDSMVSFMKFYFNVLNDDYSKIVNMEEIAEQSYDEMEAYLMLQEQIDKKMDEANERAKKAQKVFAGKNNVQLIEAEETSMNKKMKTVRAVNEHYHDVYLAFFKPYLQNKNLNKAIEKGNVGGIEQEKNALLKYAQESLIKLDGIKAFEGDAMLKDACKIALQGYIKVANDYTKPVVDFFLTKEKFESLKKEFDKKSDHTKEEVDNFNKLVKEINEASNKYNSNNKTSTNFSNDNLNNWNKTVSNFFDEKMPR